MREIPQIKVIYSRFPTKETCFSFIEKVRWNNSPVCPHCDSLRITPMKLQFRHHCNACNTSFSVTVNTIFHNTRIPMQKWLAAITLYMEDEKKITVRKLADALEVNKNTAWAMLNRLKEASLDGEFFSRLIASQDLIIQGT